MIATSLSLNIEWVLYPFVSDTNVETNLAIAIAMLLLLYGNGPLVATLLADFLTKILTQCEWTLICGKAIVHLQSCKAS